MYNTDYGDVAPRLSLAWNPSATNGFLGKLVGDHKTVIRGGFAMVYDRSNTVQSVEIPMLGIGFDQNIFVAAPACNATGPGGAGCNAAGGVAANPGLASFRVGTDGTLPLPTPSAATSPIIPGVGQETLSFQVDPNTKVGRSYNFDFSIQRELPGNVILEAAYIGRESRHLPQAVNVNSAPYMFVDSASNQSFAQAYDLVANALRAGQTAPTEPFFENQFPGLAKLKDAASATAYIVGANKSSFTGGNVGSLFLNLDTYRRQLGLQAYDSDQAQVEFMRTYVGYGNYNAGIITLTKRMSHGFTISGNYTYAKALDDGLSNQNNAGFYSNSFNPSVQYGPSSYDRRQRHQRVLPIRHPRGEGAPGARRAGDRLAPGRLVHFGHLLGMDRRAGQGLGEQPGLGRRHSDYRSDGLHGPDRPASFDRFEPSRHEYHDLLQQHLQRHGGGERGRRIRIEHGPLQQSGSGSLRL